MTRVTRVTGAQVSARSPWRRSSRRAGLRLAGALSGVSALVLALAPVATGATPAPQPGPTSTSTAVGGTDSDGSAADDPSSLAERQHDVAGSLTDASQDLETATGASVQASAALAAAQAQLPAASAALANAKAAQASSALALAAATKAVAATQAQLQQLAIRTAIEQAQVASKRSRLDAAVRASYIAGPQGLARTFVDADDPTQILDDSLVLGRQGQQTQAVLTAIDKVIATLATDTARQQTDAAALLAQRSAAATAATKAAAATTAAEADAERLQSLVHQRGVALQAAKSQLAADQSRYDELQTESDRITALLAAAEARAASQPTVRIGKGGLLWPTSGPITSPFGYRVDPVTHQRALHAGVDIGAPEGQAIEAAQAGVVAFAGQEQGYGNYTCIDHGGGFATCYAHQSAIFVTVGETVARGQRIGLVGETGYATGPHLHFETRINGVPVDPMQYF